MKRGSSTNPTSILVLGLLLVAGMGLTISYLTQTKAILRLRPELEKIYGVHGFRCSLHPNDLRIDVELPDTLVLDRFGRRRLGAVAFGIYLKLRKQQTEFVKVQVLPEPVETVTIDECQRFQVVEEQLTALAQEMGTLSGSPVQITAAPGIQGVCLLVTASCDDAGVRKVAEVLAKKPNVSFVQVKRGSAVVYETGLDWKTYTTIAPVGSR